MAGIDIIQLARARVQHTEEDRGEHAVVTVIAGNVVVGQLDDAGYERLPARRCGLYAFGPAA